jgi:Zn-dependent alcohol dehydrogenase
MRIQLLTIGQICLFAVTTPANAQESQSLGDAHAALVRAHEKIGIAARQLRTAALLPGFTAQAEALHAAKLNFGFAAADRALEVLDQKTGAVDLRHIRQPQIEAQGHSHVVRRNPDRDMAHPRRKVAAHCADLVLQLIAEADAAHRVLLVNEAAKRRAHTRRQSL